MKPLIVRFEQIVHGSRSSDRYYVDIGGELYRGDFKMWFDVMDRIHYLKPKKELEKVRFLNYTTKVPKEVIEKYEIPLLHGRKITKINSGELTLEKAMIDLRTDVNVKRRMAKKCSKTCALKREKEEKRVDLKPECFTVTQTYAKAVENGIFC